MDRHAPAVARWEKQPIVTSTNREEESTLQPNNNQINEKLRCASKSLRHANSLPSALFQLVTTYIH